MNYRTQNLIAAVALFSIVLLNALLR